MGTKADFYVGMGKKSEWIGSLLSSGDVWNIPVDIFIQVNQMMFEEMVLEFLHDHDGVVDEWPHPWSDSRMSDYSYIFYPEHEKVYMSQAGEILVDPIKILQGQSLTEANVFLGEPKFPIMLPQTLNQTEELLKQYGLPSTSSV